MIRIQSSWLFLCAVLLTSAVHSKMWWNKDNGLEPIRCLNISNCTCQANDTIVDCQHQNFVIIPPQIPTSVQILRFGWNRVVEIPEKAFESFPDLVELNIEYNQIINVSDRAFEGLRYLEILRLTGNKISYTDTFQRSLKSLTQLIVLEIQQNVTRSDNEIFPGLALSEMKQLQNLSVDLLDGNVTGYSLQSVKHLVVKNLKSNRCHLSVLRRHLLLQLVPMASSVTLQNCGILTLENGSFEGLQLLETLDLSFNENMGFKVMANVTRGISDKISSLILTQVHPLVGDCITLSEDFVIPIRNLSLKRLVLNTNRLSSINVSLVQYMPTTLEELDASDNQLIINTYIGLLMLCHIVDNLRVLNVSNEGINYFMSGHQFKRSIGYNTRKTHLYGGNSSALNCPNINLHMFRYCRNIYSLPPKLEVLDFSVSKLDVYIDRGLCICAPTELRHVNFSNNRLRGLKGRFLGLVKLETLDLSINACKKIGREIFHDVPTLQYLNLAHNFLALDIEADNEGLIFSKLSNLKTLDLSHNQIRMLPKNIFMGLKSLVNLKLSGNRVKEFDVQMTQLTSLNILLLNQNDLESLKAVVTTKLDKRKGVQIDLSENQLKCKCDSQEFVHWLATTHVDLLSIAEYTCIFPGVNGDSSVNLTKPKVLYENLTKYCYNYTPLITGTSLCIVAISIIIITAIIYRHRWNLRYMYYYAKFRFKGYIQIHNRNDNYEFDAFVCYSDHEKRFLIDSLIPELEDKRGLRLCVHERDFIGGNSVTGNVVRAIATSGKTLLLMSKQFTESSWCKFEMNMARLEGINTNRDVLCVIKMDEFDTDKLPLEIMEVMRSQTYVDMPKDKKHMEVFWDRVKKAIVQQ